MDIKKLLADLVDAGLSQAEIAHEIGVTQGRVNQVINTPDAGFRGQATIRLIDLHTRQCALPEKKAA